VFIVVSPVVVGRVAVVDVWIRDHRERGHFSREKFENVSNPLKWRILGV
jgi:hypothetical protein